MQSKLISFNEIEKILEKYKSKGLKIVQCHGVFDLLHPGHIRHLKTAKSQGDKLIVTVTPDRFVNKGPGRPVFNEQLRLETLSAMNFVDYVVLNDAPDAVSAILRIKPNIYVKGMEYKDHDQDVTGKISEEVNAVEKNGGTIFYSDDIVFSSSKLLNSFIQPPSPTVASFIEKLKKEFSSDQIIDAINELSKLKVLVIGDAILDQYQYVEPLGQSGKGTHMTAVNLEDELFLGGSLIIANHISQFTKNVTLISGIGKNCPNKEFIFSTLEKNIDPNFIYFEKYPTLLKKRYVLKDGKTLTKLFETYSSNAPLLNDENSNIIIDLLKNGTSYDLILVADFGNGFTNKEIKKQISKSSNFLALNTQTNSGNRGYNVVTHYDRADYISLNEPELRFAAHDKYGPLLKIVSDIMNRLKTNHISVTKGVNGVECFDEKSSIAIPAFVDESIDRVGAGDAFFALSSLCFAKKYSKILAGFIGSLASSLNVQIVGNKESIRKDALCKFLIRLMK